MLLGPEMQKSLQDNNCLILNFSVPSGAVPEIVTHGMTHCSHTESSQNVKLRFPVCICAKPIGCLIHRAVLP